MAPGGEANDPSGSLMKVRISVPRCMPAALLVRLSMLHLPISAPLIQDFTSEAPFMISRVATAAAIRVVSVVPLVVVSIYALLGLEVSVVITRIAT